MKEIEQEEKPNNDESIKKKKPKVNYLFNHTYAKGIKKVKKYVDGQMINIELFEDDEKDNKAMKERDLVRVFDQNIKKVFENDEINIIKK